jgi:hypothetical protein
MYGYPDVPIQYVNISFILSIFLYKTLRTSSVTVGSRVNLAILDLLMSKSKHRFRMTELSPLQSLKTEFDFWNTSICSFFLIRFLFIITSSFLIGITQ